MFIINNIHIIFKIVLKKLKMSTRWVGKLTIIIPDDKIDAEELAKSAYDSKKPYHEARYDKLVDMNGKI